MVRMNRYIYTRGATSDSGTYAAIEQFLGAVTHKDLEIAEGSHPARM
jgi:hypothetical protein